MNVAEMVDELASRLEDLDKDVFTDAFKLLTLNNAQNKVAHLLVNELLTELEVKQTLTNSSGVITLDGTGTVDDEDSTGTPHKILRGAEGVLRVACNDTGVFATRLAIKDLKKQENTFYAASSQNPLYYIFQNQVYVLPTTATKWDLYYLKQPTELLYKFPVSTGDADGFTIADYADYGISAVGNTYKYAVVWRSEGVSTDFTFYIVTANAAAGDNMAFTTEPSTGTNWSDTDYVAFLSHDFDQLYLEGVECDLNESLHELIVSFAEAECWKMANKLDRAKVTLEMALLEVKTLNDRYKVESGMGIGSRNRE